MKTLHRLLKLQQTPAAIPKTVRIALAIPIPNLLPLIPDFSDGKPTLLSLQRSEVWTRCKLLIQAAAATPENSAGKWEVAIPQYSQAYFTIAGVSHRFHDIPITTAITLISSKRLAISQQGDTLF